MTVAAIGHTGALSPSGLSEPPARVVSSEPQATAFGDMVRPGNAPDRIDARQGPFQAFEAMVVSQLVSTMMNAGGESVFGGGTAMSAYTTIFADAIGEEVARRGGIGIAEAVASRTPA